MVRGDFGHQLRQERLAAGLSQEALARRAGLSVDAIAALERGRRRHPRPATARALADALQLPGQRRERLLAAARRADSAAGQDGREILGREAEIAALAARLHPAGPERLITLTGAGGIGKTTLAHALLGQIEARYPDGVVLVDLSTITDPAQALTAVVRRLGLTAVVGRGVSEVAAAVAGRRILLVLDCLERLLPAFGSVVASLVEHAPDLAVVATSRVPLGVRAEQRFPLRPLAVAADPTALERTVRSATEALRLAGTSPAVRLFLDRARAVAPQFELTEGNAADVVRLCARLDGLPLAIELAAARMAVLPIPVLLERLDKELDVLTGTRPDRPDRQQSLRATLDWSHDLLTPGEQRVFAAMAVFRGGCTVAAAERVCGGPAVLDHVAALVDANMVHRPAAGEDRLTMLDTVREYATGRLHSSGVEEQLRDRHLDHYLAVARQAHQTLRTQRQADSLAAFAANYDNLVAAVEWGFARRPETGVDLAVELWRMWYFRGPLAEGRRVLERALALWPTEDARRAALLHGAAAIAFKQGDLARAREYSTRCLRLRRRLGTPLDLADALNSAANVARDQGDYPTANRWYREALEIFRRLDHPVGTSVTLNNLGTTARYQRDFDAAAGYHVESVALRRGAGDLLGVGYSLEQLAQVALDRGDAGTATRYAEESLALRRQLGDQHGVATALSVLAAAARAGGAGDRARDHGLRALSTALDVGASWAAGSAMVTLAGIAVDAGDWHRAARLHGTVSAWLSTTAALRPPDQARLRQDTDAARRALGATQYECGWAIGQAMSPRQLLDGGTEADGSEPECPP